MVSIRSDGQISRSPDALMSRMTYDTRILGIMITVCLPRSLRIRIATS